jgi:hypothetical protein
MESWGARVRWSAMRHPRPALESFADPLLGKGGPIRYAAASCRILGAKWERQTARRLAEMRWQ